MPSPRDSSQSVQGLKPGRGDQAERVDGQEAGRIGHAEVGQMPGFPHQCQRVDDDIGPKVSAGMCGDCGQGPRSELRKSVSPSVR